MNTAAIDASSAILLVKAGLHHFLPEIYDLIMPGSVYREITCNSLPGAQEFKQLKTDGKIRVEPALENAFVKNLQAFNRLDVGEQEVITLFYNEKCDFIITDDGKAARCCMAEKIPFINALLVPVIMRLSKINDNLCQDAMDRIIELGRYSKDIISFAMGSTGQDLDFFLPKVISSSSE